jgi:uncharacterized protein with ParB-like and HNH nuclease domain
MQANDTKLQPLIEGSKQYLVPLFQRPYRWDKSHWSTLWEDILELTTEDAGKSHFMGAIVTMPAHTIPEGITKYLLIDGQQRLTTILILMTALRDSAKDVAGNLAARIHEQYLTNKFHEDEDFFKLLPTQVDREFFINLIQEKGIPSKHRIKDAYTFFIRKLTEPTKENLERLFHTITSRLLFVSIVLGTSDNAYLIFEGLNAKGLPLTQADLIRNYFLMRIHRKRQDNVYNTRWLPMQSAFDENLTEFIRHFLMRDSTFVKQNEVYAALKAETDNFNEEETIAYLETLNKFASYYQKLLNPDTEANPVLRKRLVALKRLDITTAYPFLLSLFDDLASKKCTENEFVEVLKMLESFLVRRFVCSVPTHDLNKFFPSLLSQAKKFPSLVEGIAATLSKRAFPRNAEYRRHLFMTKLYGPGERSAKTKLILERLEESYGHKEEVQTKELTIEHIMPQTLTDWWKEHLGEDWEQVHERYLHTIGNLTLTGYNAPLSNLSFDEKRRIYADSHVEMTKGLSTQNWTEAEIKARIEDIYEKAILIWSNLGAEDEPEIDEVEVEGEPEDGFEPAMTVAEVVELLGGGEPIKPSKYCFRLNDGLGVIVSISKRYAKGKPYWYGLSPTFLSMAELHNCSHIAFGMGSNQVALVPADIVKNYVGNCTVSRYKDESVHHYHFSISNTDSSELYGNQDSPRISIAKYIRKR